MMVLYPDLPWAFSLRLHIIQIYLFNLVSSMGKRTFIALGLILFVSLILGLCFLSLTLFSEGYQYTARSTVPKIRISQGEID